MKLLKDEIKSLKNIIEQKDSTLEALKALKPFGEVAKKRGLTMAELLN